MSNLPIKEKIIGKDSTYIYKSASIENVKFLIVQVIRDKKFKLITDIVDGPLNTIDDAKQFIIDWEAESPQNRLRKLKSRTRGSLPFKLNSLFKSLGTKEPFSKSYVSKVAKKLDFDVAYYPHIKTDIIENAPVNAVVVKRVLTGKPQANYLIWEDPDDPMVPWKLVEAAAGDIDSWDAFESKTKRSKKYKLEFKTFDEAMKAAQSKLYRKIVKTRPNGVSFYAIPEDAYTEYPKILRYIHPQLGGTNPVMQQVDIKVNENDQRMLSYHFIERSYKTGNPPIGILRRVGGKKCLVLTIHPDVQKTLQPLGKDLWKRPDGGMWFTRRTKAILGDIAKYAFMKIWLFPNAVETNAALYRKTKRGVKSR